MVPDLTPVPFEPTLSLATTTSPALIDPNVKTVVPIPVHNVDCAAVTRKTIARWVAHKLKEPAMADQTNLAEAFKDGTLLARLLKKLSGETVDIVANPVKEQDSLSNLSACFKFMQAAGIDTRRISFTDFSSQRADRVSMLLYRLILWNEFDWSWACEGAEPVHIANAADSSMPALWNNPDQTIPKAQQEVGGLESAASTAMLAWMQSLRVEAAATELEMAEQSDDAVAAHKARQAVLEAAECPVRCALDIADGQSLCTLVAFEHQNRFGQPGWSVFESLFGITKADDWFRIEDSSAAQKCERAMKVLERVLRIPNLLDAEEVGRDPTSLTIYLTVARARISAIRAHENERAESKVARRQEAIQEQQQALELQQAQEVAALEARQAALVKQAEADAALAAAAAERERMILQAEEDKKLRLENAEMQLKHMRAQALNDLKEKNRQKLQEMNTQLRRGLVSLDGKQKGHADSLLKAQTQESDDCMDELAKRVAAQKLALAQEKELIDKVRECDDSRLTPAERLVEGVQNAERLHSEITAQAAVQQQRVEECESWIVDSYDQIAQAKTNMETQYARDVQLVCQETSLTERAVAQSRQAHQSEMHSNMKEHLVDAAVDRKLHDAARELEMEKLSLATAAHVAEAVDAQYRKDQRIKADYLASDQSALSPVRKAPN